MYTEVMITKKIDSLPVKGLSSTNILVTVD